MIVSRYTKQKPSHLIWVVMSIVMASLLTVSMGCSIIGLSMGAAKDSRKPHGLIDVWDIAVLEKGVPIRITQSDGNLVAGKYAGIGEVKRSEYQEYYVQSKADSPDLDFLPDLGDTVTVFGESGAETRAEFYGFYSTHVGETWISYISGRPLDNRASGNIELGTIDTLKDEQGKVIDITRLTQLIIDRTVPISTAITVRIGDDTYFAPLARIDKIEILSKKTGTLTGFVSGLAIDIVIGYFIYSAIKNFDIR
jgi:hypothetical protein